MPPQTNANESYEHVLRVKWPRNLKGPNYWKPDSDLLWELPKDIMESVGRVTSSGIRFYQKVTHRPAPMISGDTNDPDVIHALEFALNRQDELESAILQSTEHRTERLLSWLQERRRSLVKSMQAVAVAEEGEMYDVANREPWEGRPSTMKNEQVEQLRFIFRTIMARIDTVPAEHWKEEVIQPTCREVTVHAGPGPDVYFPPAPSVSFWDIFDDSLMESSTPKMHQAALTLYHQGRVVSAARNKLPLNEQNPPPPVLDVIIRAMSLAVRSIDLVWMERQKDLPKAKEERLLAWLRERKDAVVKLLFALIEFHLPAEVWFNTVKINSTGTVFVLDHNGYSEAGKLFDM